MAGTSPAITKQEVSSEVDLIPRSRRLVGGVGARRVALRTAIDFLPLQLEARLFLRTVGDERQPYAFPSRRRIERREADIRPALVDLAALRQLIQDSSRILEVEHRLAPHVPIGVAGMRVVGELDVHRPTVALAVGDLPGDLLIRQVGQETEGTLCYTHDGCLLLRRR